MNLSKIGKIAEKYWREIPEHFPFTELNEFTIMPNHIHGIVGINHNRRDGDSSRLCHAGLMCSPRQNAMNRDAINRDAINRRLYDSAGGITGKNNPMGKNTLGEIIRWYKGRCKFEIGKISNVNFAWQPRFYDRVVRDDKELDRIMNSNIYICDNSKIEYIEIENILQKQKKDVGIDIVIFDYFQLLKDKSNTEIIGKLKRLAKELNFTVILLSQLKRTVDQRENKYPIIEDIPDINGKDKNIDSIFFIYRPAYYSINILTESNESNFEIIIAKHESKFTQNKTTILKYDSSTKKII